MAKKRKPKYIKILEGMNCCYGGTDERNCAECPYDKYNERDFYGQGSSVCMEKLNSDAKKWTESMTFFTTCGDCCCWRKNFDEKEEWHPEWEGTDGYCANWKTIMGKDEYCSRGGYVE